MHGCAWAKADFHICNCAYGCTDICTDVSMWACVSAVLQLCDNAYPYTDVCTRVIMSGAQLLALTAAHVWLCQYCYAQLKHCMCWPWHMYTCVIVPELICTFATLHMLALTDGNMCDSASTICIFAILHMHVLTDARMCVRASTCHIQLCKLVLMCAAVSVAMHIASDIYTRMW